jgi:hypothetical protein
MRSSVADIQTYSAQQRRAEKARRRKHDSEQAAAGQAEQVQARNRLVPNPKEWELECSEEPVNE